MISIIPAREIMVAVTDENIDSSESKIRVKAFEEANFLLAQKYAPVEIIIEGILFNKIKPRLNDEHKKAFNFLYNIDNSAVDVEGYNITKAIKFIAKSNTKIKLPHERVIIITENVADYSDIISPRIKVYTPRGFIERVNKYKEIVEDFDSMYSALITAFFI